MKFILFTLALMMMPFASFAQEGTRLSGMPSGLYKLDKTHASLIWKVSHLGLSDYTARFTNFDVDLMLDAQDPVRSRVKATIDPTSIKTDYPNIEKKDFDAQLVNDAGWFNATQFPAITFTSTKVEKTGDSTGQITGNLGFLGVTKPITLDVTFNKALGNHPFANKPAIGFSATGSLKRSDFGMNTYIPQIGDEVEFMIEAEFFYDGSSHPN